MKMFIKAIVVFFFMVQTSWGFGPKDLYFSISKSTPVYETSDKKNSKTLGRLLRKSQFKGINLFGFRVKKIKNALYYLSGLNPESGQYDRDLGWVDAQKAKMIPIPSLKVAGTHQPFISYGKEITFFHSFSGTAFFSAHYSDFKLFVGIAELEGRVWLADYDENKFEVTQIHGWADKKNLLTNSSVIKIGEVVDKICASDNTKPTKPMCHRTGKRQISKYNKLLARFITEPDKKARFTRYPGSTQTNKTFETFTWYYVYDVTVPNNVLYYYLASPVPDLFEGLRVNGTGEKYDNYIKNNLLGWVEQKDKHLWGSNLVYEINTHLEAMPERVEQSKPAIVLDKPDSLSKGINCQEATTQQVCRAAEHLKAWGSRYDKNGQLKFPGILDIKKAHISKQKQLSHQMYIHNPWGAPDPYGLRPSIPRLHAIGEVKDNFFKVVSLGAVNDKSVQGEQISRMFIAYNDIIKNFTTLQLVFLIDGSGSMAGEIDNIGHFMKELLQKVEQSAQTGDSEIQLTHLERSENYNAALKVKVSLALYYDVGEPVEWIFKQFPIKKAVSRIEQGLGDKLNAGCEGIFDGLNTVVSDDIWTKNPLTMLIVFADEPGGCGNFYNDDDPIKEKETKTAVITKLKNTENKVKQAAQGYNIDPNNIKKEDIASIWGIYSEDVGDGFDTLSTEWYWSDHFVNNLSGITSQNNLHSVCDDNNPCPNDEAFDESDNKTNRFRQLLHDSILDAHGRMKEMLKGLKYEITCQTETKAAICEQTQGSIMTLGRYWANQYFAEHNIQGKDKSLITNFGFITGFITIKEEGLKYPSYRSAFLIRADETKQYWDKFTSLHNTMEEALKAGEETECSIGEAMLRGICATAPCGDIQSIFDIEDKNERCNATYDVMNREYYQHKTVQELLYLPESLPAKGLLGKTLWEVAEMELMAVNLWVSTLSSQVKCWDNILNGKIVPDQIENCGLVTADAIDTKEWKFKHPISHHYYYYIPPRIIPGMEKGEAYE